MSFDEGSNEDDSDVVEQSLMQLRTNPSTENSEEDEDHLDLHLLVLQPGNMLEEADVVMSEVDAPCSQMEKSHSSTPSQTPNDLSSVGSVVSHLSIGGIQV